MNIGQLLFDRAMESGLFKIDQKHDGHALSVRVFGMWVTIAVIKSWEIEKEMKR